MADQDFQNRIFEVLSGIESRLEKRLDTIDTRLGTVERDVGWIKGKLEASKKAVVEC